MLQLATLRPWVRRTAGLAVLAVFALSIWGLNGLSATPASRAVGDTSYTPGGAPAAAGYGFASSLASLSAAQLDQRLAAMKQAGATWVRYDLSWSAVQAGGPSSYDWSVSDRVTAAVAAHGLNIVLIVDLTPAWARPAGCSSELCGPSDPAAYARFAGAAVAHYRPYGVRTWEIWNEPNISYRFRPATDPARYVQMLRGADAAIKKADAGATVIAASTAPSASEDGSLTPLDFLQAMYDNGAQGSFDAIAAHPYTYPLTPSQTSPYDAWGRLTYMHDLMAKHGDGAKKIWLTEFGAPTNGPNKPGEYVSEAVQATIASEAIAQLKSWSWAGPLFWYDYQDAGTGTWTSENFYGLVRADGSHKPAYDVFAAAARGQ